MIRFAHLNHTIVFNVEYRLAPETKCPGGQIDFKKAFLHIHKNADKYGINRNKIVIGGEDGGSWIACGAVYDLVVNN